MREKRRRQPCLTFLELLLLFVVLGAHLCLSAQLSYSLGGGAELELSGHHSLDTVVHVLDELDLTTAETTPVGDVEDTIAGVGVLAVLATDLHVVLVGDALEARPVLHEVGELDVDGGAHGGTEVGGARGDVTKVIVVGELGHGLDVGSSSGETGEDGTDVGTRLHGDDTELILLVNPDEESLGIVVEDTTTLGPVAVQTASLKEAVTLPV